MQAFLQTTTRLSYYCRALSWGPRKNLLPEKWSPPPQGVLKLNVDGATFEDENTTRTGAIIRDWRRKFIAASVRKFEGEAEAMRVEIRAVKEGLGLAFNLGIRALCLEVDAKFVLESFHHSTIILTYNGIILS